MVFFILDSCILGPCVRDSTWGAENEDGVPIGGLCEACHSNTFGFGIAVSASIFGFTTLAMPTYSAIACAPVECAVGA